MSRPIPSPQPADDWPIADDELAVLVLDEIALRNFDFFKFDHEMPPGFENRPFDRGGMIRKMPHSVYGGAGVRHRIQDLPRNRYRYRFRYRYRR